MEDEDSGTAPATKDGEVPSKKGSAEQEHPCPRGCGAQLRHEDMASHMLAHRCEQGHPGHWVGLIYQCVNPVKLLGQGTAKGILTLLMLNPGSNT